MADFDYEELLKATDNFNPTMIIGKGSHGMVYKGVVFKENRLVAIKKPSQGLQSLHDNSKLENEIRVLSSLCESPHLVKLLGTSYDHENSLKNKHKLIVMELMPNGSLHDWLHAAKTPPTWPKRVEIAMQIARAVQFLHEGKPLVIHRDIKSSNILFDSQWNAKLADFGLAVKGVDPLSQPAGTIGYIDPCYTTPCKLSTKNDMFSFGVVLLEIMSGRKAIDVCKTPASIVEWAIPLIEEKLLEEICDTTIMALPEQMFSSITNLLHYAARCVSQNEDDRPSAREVVVGMEKCFVERVRFSIWRSVLKCMVRLRKKRKLSQTRIQCIAQEEGQVDSDTRVSRGKLSITIKDVLADVTFE
ncbi:serine/threonine-protein kinase-like protein At5g23170 [Abrus precatorius]|uniref:non-specific serine/threonine protein kinase n=1 Tax=Abrus precatorius TaxID=3816 RepID=A0A8B8K2Q6_ABRPR|nr:serine/threonine-protein kinase-like protein At5g23170 [Abrus precatorius]